jgi:hypothetical protein
VTFDKQSCCEEKDENKRDKSVEISEQLHDQDQQGHNEENERNKSAKMLEQLHNNDQQSQNEGNAGDESFGLSNQSPSMSSGSGGNVPRHFLNMVSFGKLVVPSTRIFQLLEKCEKIFRALEHNLINHTTETLMLKCLDIIHNSNLPKCHRLADSAVSKFIKLRLHIYATNKTQSAKIKVQHGSKSAKARTLIK